MSGYIRQTHAHPAAGLKNRIGVYFTKMKPNNSKIALIENNYRNYKDSTDLIGPNVSTRV